MRKFCVTLFVLAVMAFILPAAVACGEVPRLSPTELVDIPVSAISGINQQEAHWIWQILVSEYAAAAIEWLFTTGVTVLLGWLGLKGSRLARCVIYIATAVREIYASFVRPAKLKSSNGKLTEAARVMAMECAIDRAREIAAEHGLELFKVLSKEVAGTLAELFVRMFKGGKKSAVAGPLPDSAPLPPSV